MYGATKGKLFAAGLAGDRFCVRNSGVISVIEGVGDHGCEYMTGGIVLCLGQIGRNFAAGMSGGIAYVLDNDQVFESLCNKELVGLESLSDEQEIMFVKQLIEKHYSLTNSKNAHNILTNWRQFVLNFVKVIPHDYKRILSENNT